MINYKSTFKTQQEFHQKGFIKLPFEDMGLSDFIPILASFEHADMQAMLNVQQPLSFDTSLLDKHLGYYYNEDNKLIREFSFETPSSNLISVGTIYAAINHTSEVLYVADYDNNKIKLNPNELCILNLGLVGIPFELKGVGVLQCVMHSELDGIEYFQSGEPLSQTSTKQCASQPSSIFLNPFNHETWVDLGFAVNGVNEEYADKLLELVKKEHFKSVEQSKLDEYCGYEDRFISKHSFYKPRAIKPQFQELMDEVNKIASPILDNKPNPNGDNLSIFAATKGHFMDSHADCADGSPLITIVYLSGDDFGEGDGGDISSARCDLCDKTKRLVERAKDAKAPPKHGFAIHVNNSDIRFVHEVHEILSDKFRYSIIMNSSMLTNPNWYKEFDEISGRFEMETSKLDKPE